MKKYLKITLLSFLILIIILIGLLFTQMGNNLIKPLLQSELEKQVGLPVELKLFKLRHDHTEIKIIVNKSLSLDLSSIFNLLGLNFDGTYTIYANNFVYDTINFKQANINGEFKGTPSDMLVNGKGNTFNAPLNYYLRLLNGDAKEIQIQLKDMNISDILSLLKQPALAKGKVDANVTIPTLAQRELNAYGIMNFSNMTFNDTLIKKLYKISMPEAIQCNGILDANISETQAIGNLKMQSDIANVELKNVNFDTHSKHYNAQYLIDILNLNSLSGLFHTKLDGKIILEGEVKKEEILTVTGHTESLGGEINYKLLNKNFSASLNTVPVKNMLHMFSFPAFVNAEGTGAVDYNLSNKKGKVKLAMEDFRLASNTVTKSLALVIQKDPSSIIFGESSLEASIDGIETGYTLMAKSHKASITVDEAIINSENDSHKAKMEFAYDKYAIAGSIDGSIRNPRIGFDTKGLVPDFTDKAEKEIKRFFKRLF